MHGFLSRDGVSPQKFAAMARAELKRYPNVQYAHVEVTDAFRIAGGFTLMAGALKVSTRKLLIATGLVDDLPEVDGVQALFGTSVFQCPYCDGWEFRDKALAAYGKRNRGFEMARALTAWSRDIVLCTDGPAGLTQQQLSDLSNNGITLLQQPLARLEAEGGALRRIVFRDGTHVARDALFFDTPSHAQSNLTETLGCTFNRHGGIVCGKYEATAVPGLYVAGNIIRNVQLSIVAAAEGANAAFGINRALTREDFVRRSTGITVTADVLPPVGPRLPA
jgi:thioredoxin reductase